MAHIPKKQWDELTDREREILKSIGIRPNGKHKAPVEKPRATRAPDPYTIEVTVICQLCKGTPKQYFDMIPSDEEGAPHLHAVAISKENALKRKNLRKKDSYQSTCSECFNRLHDWTKEELIKKLIKVYPLASIGAGR